MTSPIRARSARLTALLLATTALAGGGAIAMPVQAQAQGTLSIPAQPLDSALRQLMDATGIEVTYGSALSRGRTSSPVNGAMAPTAALSRLIAGSGLTYRQTGPGSFILEAAPAVQDGAVQLGTLRIEGQGGANPSAPIDRTVRPGWDGSAASVYTAPGAVSVIAREQIEQFPGLSPVDLLKSAPGVLSGESRSSGGLDANIRGLQGQGRVPVTIDGTLNGSTVYRGYQGVGNRTFVDIDFLGGVSIEKGPSTGGGVGGIGGTVNVTTLNVGDILAAGESFGLRLKASLNDNVAPTQDAALRMSGLDGAGRFEGDTDRPDPFAFGGGSVSAVLAARSESFDLLAGFSHRRSGDYHVGEEGDAAPRPGSPIDYCLEEPEEPYCLNAGGWYEGPGLTRFVGGERVLNTSQDIKSALIKATWRIGFDHALELAYSKYISQFGENYPASVYRNTDDVYQGVLSRTDLDRYSLRYAWNPDNELFRVKANLWATDMVEASQALGNGSSLPKFVNMRGADVANTSRFDTGLGDIVAEYGLSYLNEETGPESGQWGGIPGRQGSRDETSGFARAVWTPVDRLRLDGSLRYAWAEVDDELALPTDPKRDYDGGGFTVGAAFEVGQGVQVFASYKDALRLPSLLEATRGFILSADPALEPERARNWELGVNYAREGLWRAGDVFGAKLVWFDNDITDYISREYNTSTYSMRIFNIDKAKFAGFELSTDYSAGNFKAGVAATYYTDVEFCRRGRSCIESSLAADYATNQIPPEFAASATISQTFLDDRLTLSGRVNYVGERSVPFEVPGSGASPFIAAIPWNEHTTADLFAAYALSPAARFEIAVENLTDEYYVEPLSLGLVPAPGRTIRVGMTSSFSGSPIGGGVFWRKGPADDGAVHDWSGPYAGFHAGSASGPARANDFTFRVNGNVNEQRNYDLGDIEGGFGGLQAGYNLPINSLILIGLEATYDRGTLEAGAVPYRDALFNLQADGTTTVRARLGVTRGAWLLYGAAGWAQTDVDYLYERDGQTYQGSGSADGYVAAAGAEYALGERASLRLEYALHDLEGDSLGSSTTAFGLEFENAARPRLQTDQVSVGVNFRF